GFARMGQNPQCPRIRAPAVTRPGFHRRDFHEHVAPALFAGFDDITLELFDFPLARMNDTSLRGQRYEARYSKLGQLFHEKLPAISLRQGRGDLQCEGQFTFGIPHAHHVESDAAALNVDDAGGVFPAVAVEQANRVAGAETPHRGKMVSLGAGQLDRPRRQRPVDVKSFRHPWYNTSPVWRMRAVA